MDLKNSLKKTRYGIPALALIVIIAITGVAVAAAGYMLYTDSDSIVVNEPEDIEVSVTGDEIVWGENAEIDVTLTNSEDATYLVEGEATFNVTKGDSDPEQIQAIIQYKESGEWTTLWNGTIDELDGKTVDYGPSGGWEIDPSYEETTNYRIGVYGTPDDDLRIDYDVSVDVVEVVSPLE